jgi:hypothetical protein
MCCDRLTRFAHQLVVEKQKLEDEALARRLARGSGSGASAHRNSEGLLLEKRARICVFFSLFWSQRRRRGCQQTQYLNRSDKYDSLHVCV